MVVVGHSYIFWVSGHVDDLRTAAHHSYSYFISLYIYIYIYIYKDSTYPVAGYPDGLGSSSKHFLTVIVLHLFMASIFPICQIHVRNYVVIFYLYVNKYVT